MDQQINQVLHNRYYIRSLLGRQAGRRTYLARDLQTGLLVVIKFLLFDSDFNWQDLKLFEREAGVLKSLDHLAIPRYVDYFDVEFQLKKGFALVQSYAEAKSLQDWIQSGRTFSEVELKAIAKQLLEILHYLHSRQPPVIHRDIKPSNILLGDRSAHSPGKVYLIDFGSVQTTAQYGTKTIVGTYGYMPFEQFSGQTTPASDLYALGATLIYLATGQHPDQLPQRKMRIVFENKTRLSSSLVNWLKGMTEPSMELRLQSATQALNALVTSNLQIYSPSVAIKPADSRVRVTSTNQTLEIVIPPYGLHFKSVFWGLLNNLYSVFFWMSFLFFVYGGYFSSWIFTLFLIHPMISCIFNLLVQVRLQITSTEIAVSHEVLTFRYLSSAVPRQNIVKLEQTHCFETKDSEGNNITVPPQLNIWVGTQKIEFGGGRLTNPEFDWLAQELSNWLDIPVTKLNAAESARK